MPVDSRIPIETITAPLAAAMSFVKTLRKPAHILVAISGGSDSTGLLLALHAATAQAGRGELRLSAVTVDHALRAASADEARMVAALCAELGIPHALRRWGDLKPTSGISQASRLARYRLIAEVASQIGADFVVTGHTIGDQRETVAMRAARSEGEDNLGLSGMADGVLYNGRHWIMRPFLTCERQAIRDYLSSRSRQWVDDPSNENISYERVRVRRSLADSSTRLDDDAAVRRQALSEKTAIFLREQAEVFHAALARFPGSALNCDLGEFRHGLAALVAVLGGRAYLPAAGGMERVFRFLRSGESGRMTIGRVLLDRRRDGLYLVREQRNLPQLDIGPNEQDAWDDRFLVKNGSAVPVRVTARLSVNASDAAMLFPSVPAGLARQAMRSLPQIAAVTGEGGEFDDGIDIVPRLALFDLFLPRFDLELANAIAVLFGRAPYPQPPV